MRKMLTKSQKVCYAFVSEKELYDTRFLVQYSEPLIAFIVNTMVRCLIIKILVLTSGSL